jgi:hypothetical protein
VPDENKLVSGACAAPHWRTASNGIAVLRTSANYIVGVASIISLNHFLAHPFRRRIILIKTIRGVTT